METMRSPHASAEERTYEALRVSDNATRTPFEPLTKY